MRVDTDFANVVEDLAEYPELGKPGLVSGTRELFPVHNYRIVYEVNGQEVWILAIAYTSRLWSEYIFHRLFLGADYTSITDNRPILLLTAQANCSATLLCRAIKPSV